MDAGDENIGEEDSQFMKLAKKLTVKTLQRKGQLDNETETFQTPPEYFCPAVINKSRKHAAVFKCVRFERIL